MAEYQKLRSDHEKGHSISRRHKQHFRLSKSDKPPTERRTLRQAFRNYRARRRAATSPAEKHYKLRRWKNKSHKSFRSSAGDPTSHQRENQEPLENLTDKPWDPQPIVPPKIHYREQVSRESLLLREEGLQGTNPQRSTLFQFSLSAGEISRSQSAPIASSHIHTEQAAFKFISLPRGIPVANGWSNSLPEDGFTNDELSEEFHSCSRQRIQVPEVETMSISETASTTSTKLNSEGPKKWSDSAGSGVMKRLETSVLSFFSFALPKYASSHRVSESGQTTGETTNRGLSLPFFKSKNSSDKPVTPLKGSVDYVDNSIYGSQAKYFI